MAQAFPSLSLTDGKRPFYFRAGSDGTDSDVNHRLQKLPAASTLESPNFFQYFVTTEKFTAIE
jgi:hypothetical protein